MSVSIELVRGRSLEGCLDGYLEGLAAVLVDGVNSGASISFLQPFSAEQATAYWRREVFPGVIGGQRLLFVAVSEGELVGTVQLVTGLVPNQQHRCEVSRLVVLSRARRRGIGRLLMEAVLERASALGKKLVTLDTRSGDPSQRLYQSLGFEVAGEIPDFALDPDRRHLSPTTYMYKRL